MNNPLALVDPFGDQCYDLNGEGTPCGSSPDGSMIGTVNQTVNVTAPDAPIPTIPSALPTTIPADPYTPPANQYDNLQVIIATNGVQGGNGSPGQSGNSQGGGNSSAPKPPNPTPNPNPTPPPPNPKGKCFLFGVSAVTWDAMGLMLEAEPPVGTVLGTGGLVFGTIALYECR